MGRDIHLQIEYRRRGEWHFLPVNKRPTEFRDAESDSWIDARMPEVFAVLDRLSDPLWLEDLSEGGRRALLAYESGVEGIVVADLVEKTADDEALLPAALISVIYEIALNRDLPDSYHDVRLVWGWSV